VGRALCRRLPCYCCIAYCGSLQLGARFPKPSLRTVYRAKKKNGIALAPITASKRLEETRPSR